MAYPNLKQIRIHENALITRHSHLDKTITLKDLTSNRHLASLENESYVFWFNDIKYSVHREFVELL